ncbi:MAG: hypothetical protein WDZ49_08425 [Litorilinea sp.]
MLISKLEQWKQGYYQQGREEGREAGREEGFEEGQEETRARLVLAMIARGFDLATIVDLIGISPEAVQAIIAKHTETDDSADPAAE